MSLAYRHSPLPCQRSIRLLKLLPGSGLVSCEVITTEEKWPSYVALSYTWGAPDESESTRDREMSIDSQFTIQCDGKTLQVTENAYRALEQLRSLDQEDVDDDDSPTYIWVDAICIDQSNVEERNNQVAMMGDIYASALGVMIWLGPSSPETTEAISLITAIGSALGQGVSASQESYLIEIAKLPFDDPAFYKELGVAPLSLQQWHSILDFFSRRWFSRGWVFQELVLAKEAIMLCGKEKLELEALMDFAIFLVGSGWIQGMATIKYYSTPSGWTGDLRTFDHNLRELIGVEAFSAAVIFRFRRKHGPEHPPYRQKLQDTYLANTYEQRLYSMLQDIIFVTRTHRVTDIRDKIFIPLALTSYYVRPKNPYRLEWLIPDYNMTVEECYVTASSWLLRNSCTLSLLSQVGDRPPIAKYRLPSWVPDYSRVNTMPLYHIPHFHATRHWHLVTPVAEHQVLTKLLKVAGCIPDSIVSLTRPVGTILNDHAVWEWIDLLGLLPSENQDLVEALWRTLACDQDPLWEDDLDNPRPYARKELGETAEGFWSQKEAYVRFAAMPGSLLPSKDEISNMWTVLTEMTFHRQKESFQWPEEVAAMRGYRHMLQYSISRRLFQTARGYLGLAPAAAQLGDAVSFLRGARVPFILREQRDKKFELIGDAYVHGYMNGEIDQLGPPNIQDILLQ